MREAAFPAGVGQGGESASLLTRCVDCRESGFAPALDGVLNGVQVNRKEGAIQALWSQLTVPWIAFDKEAGPGVFDVCGAPVPIARSVPPAVD